MSKDITGTDKENEFLVTLKVETTEQESTMTATSGADVVLVFDVSTSMDYTTGGTAPGGRGWKLSNTRWTAAEGSGRELYHRAAGEQQEPGLYRDLWRVEWRVWKSHSP